MSETFAITTFSKPFAHEAEDAFLWLTLILGIIMNLDNKHAFGTRETTTNKLLLPRNNGVSRLIFTPESSNKGIIKR